MPQSQGPCTSTPNKISLSDAIKYARQAGFTGDSLVNIVSVAMAESGLDAGAINCNNPGGAVDRGIVQINNYYHGEVSDQCSFDPQCAFKAAYTISNNGTSFQPWTTFTNNAYKQFTNQVQSALGQSSSSSNSSSSSSTATGDPCSAYANCGLTDFGCQIGGDFCKLVHSAWFEQAVLVLIGLLVALVAIVMIGLNEAKQVVEGGK